MYSPVTAEIYFEVKELFAAVKRFVFHSNMLVSYNFIIVLLLLFIIFILIKPSALEQPKSINPLNYSQEKNNVYTYLDHKIFIQNKEILKFIDSIIYYIDINPPLFMRFLDELNRFYKNIWQLGKLIDNIPTGCGGNYWAASWVEQRTKCNSMRTDVTILNNHMKIIQYEHDIIVNIFRDFKYTMPHDLIPHWEARRLVLETILDLQMENVCKRINHFNFDNKCLKRYTTKELQGNTIKEDKVEDYELRNI